MNLLKSVMPLAVFVVAAGCVDTLSPRAFDGHWAQASSVAGNFFEMTLVTSGNDVNATGSWCGEAAPCGTANGTGTIDGNKVHLDLAIVATFPVSGPVGTEHIDASMSFAGRLVGTVRTARFGDPFGDPSPITFNRVTAAVVPLN